MYFKTIFKFNRLLLGLIFIPAINIYAQSADSLSSYNLGEITITATRNEKHLIDVGRSVSVITKDDLDQSVCLMPSELLSGQEGVLVTGSGQTPGSLQSIYMRGANNNQTVIMIDGLRITDPSSVENAIDLSELTIMNINRIEMIRGSHSTLYGSSAIGGVVNIITEKNKQPGLNFDALIRTGTFGAGTSDLTQNLSLNYTTSSGFYFGGHFFNSKINGMDATIDTVTSAETFKNRDKDNHTKTAFAGKVGFANSNWDVYATYTRTDQLTDIDNGAFKDDDNYTVDFKRNLFNYGGSYKFNDWLKFSFIGGYTDMNRRLENDSSVVDAAGTFDHSYSKGVYDGISISNEAQINFNTKGISTLVGAGYYIETMNIKSYYYSKSMWGIYESQSDLDTLDINSTIKNIFAYVDINGGLIDEYLSAFNLALGGRYNNHSTFGDKITYEINPSYKMASNTLLYLSYATGFNAPPLYRLFSPEQNYQSGISRGNENLKPEYSNSIEFGLKQSLSNNLSFTVSLFSTNVENNIDYVYLWDKNIPIDELGNDWSRDDYRGDTYINTGELQTKGIEFKIDASLSKNLFASANVSYIDGKLKYASSDLDGNITQENHVQLFANGAFLNNDVEKDGLVRRANTANLTLTYLPFDLLSLRLDVRYVGERDDIYYDSQLGPYGALGSKMVDAYTLFDISVGYKIFGNLSAVLRIENIFNKKYYEIMGYTTRGRSAYLNVRYSLHGF